MLSPIRSPSTPKAALTARLNRVPGLILTCERETSNCATTAELPPIRRAAEGGNITLNSDILVGRNNSDITANARSAEGGRVNVNVPNILGFTAASREQVKSRLGLTDAQLADLQVSPTSELPTSDIAAISQSSGPALQGTVTFSASGVNPAQGLVELPQNIVAPAALIAANPCTKGAESAFTVTGKGGVPSSPDDTLSSAASPWTWVEEAGSSATDNVRDVTDRQARNWGNPGRGSCSGSRLGGECSRRSYACGE